MPTAEALITEVLTGVVSGTVYGLIWYVRNRVKAGDVPEEFDPYKLGATLLVGAVVGGAMAYSGGSVAFERVQDKLVFYAGAITMLEGLLKTVDDRFDVSLRVFGG